MNKLVNGEYVQNRGKYVEIGRNLVKMWGKGQILSKYPNTIKQNNSGFKSTFL